MGILEEIWVLYSLERGLVEGPYSVGEQFIERMQGFMLNADWVMILDNR
jgi:hypothetical protein